MKSSLLHVYRNTSMGRETYLHSLYFCKKLNIALMVYIPPKTHFSMNLDNIKIRIDLDESYLNSPNSAVGRVKGLAKSNRVDVSIISEKSSCLSGLPDLHKAVSFMTCPRSISDLSSNALHRQFFSLCFLAAGQAITGGILLRSNSSASRRLS
jgi:hypothetical protein